jgi:hypothetical protein
MIHIHTKRSTASFAGEEITEVKPRDTFKKTSIFITHIAGSVHELAAEVASKLQSTSDIQLIVNEKRLNTENTQS